MRPRIRRFNGSPVGGACLRLGHILALGLAVAVAASCVGCGGGEPSKPEPPLAEELARLLKDEQLRHQRDDARHRIEVAGAEGDYGGAVVGWASTSVAAVILILLLARERRARRVVERLLRLVLDRLRECRRPP